ncbi:MAG: hypothetical protein KA319_08455 [Ferruginibacter sp.]|nr:hypothetical protein [Ferruginibacter sp.]
MGKRQISILEIAAVAVAEVSFFIESKGLPTTAKKFVDNAYTFFETLVDDRIEYRKCTYKKWRQLGYNCITYNKKYVVAFISLAHEIIICDFVVAKLLKE